MEPTETVMLSDSEPENQIDAGVGRAANFALDPRVALELEDERDMVDMRLSKISEEISALLEEQELLERRRREIDQRLATVTSTDKAQPGSSSKADSTERWQAAFEWDHEVEALRKNLFGINKFRRHQREIINAVLSKRDVFVIMPAGGGKSLCYQLPAVLKDGVSLVISPLLSLIQDQVMNLTTLGIAASMLTSATDKEEEKTIYRALEKGDQPLRLLYVTPEKVARSKRFMSKLEKCNHAGRLSLIAIDEAHCCSQWGHDFRTDYASLAMLKKQFPKVPMMALTATATERVQADVREMLQMRRCETFVSSVNRPNLFYEVREKKSQANAVIDDVAALIKDSYIPKDSGIVYCFSRRECEQVAAELANRGIKAAFYHADMEPSARSKVHMRWSRGELQVIVGTVAFGMGINKPDVRFVIHHSMSKSIETYYQESGRAGRDGLPARCVLFYRCADVPRQSCMVFAEAAGLINLYAMARFCSARQECRRAAIFRHFGEEPEECNGMCDNCAEEQELTQCDVTEAAMAVAHLVQERQQADQKATLLQLAELVRKGNPKGLSREDTERLIVHLILTSVLKEEFLHTAYATNAYVVPGPLSVRVLKGTQKVSLEMEAHPSIRSKSKRSQKGAVVPDGPPGAALHSPMERMLDELRRQLAVQHGGIFPHSVLSSQHMAALCAAKPSSVQEVEEIVGKKRSEQYGAQILAAMEQHLREHPMDDDSAAPGQWVSPKSALKTTPHPTLAPSSKAKSVNAVGSGRGDGKAARKAFEKEGVAGTSSRPTRVRKTPSTKVELEGWSEGSEYGGGVNDDEEEEENHDDFELAKRVRKRQKS